MEGGSGWARTFRGNWADPQPGEMSGERWNLESPLGVFLPLGHFQPKEHCIFHQKGCQFSFFHENIYTYTYTHLSLVLSGGEQLCFCSIFPGQGCMNPNAKATEEQMDLFL